MSVVNLLVSFTALVTGEILNAHKLVVNGR